MHDSQSTLFLFSLILFFSLPFLSGLIDASALHLPHELLPDNITPYVKVSCMFRIQGSCCRSYIKYIVTTKLTGAAISQK